MIFNKLLIIFTLLFYPTALHASVPSLPLTDAPPPTARLQIKQAHALGRKIARASEDLNVLMEDKGYLGLSKQLRLEARSGFFHTLTDKPGEIPHGIAKQSHGSLLDGERKPATTPPPAKKGVALATSVDKRKGTMAVASPAPAKVSPPSPAPAKATALARPSEKVGKRDGASVPQPSAPSSSSSERKNDATGALALKASPLLLAPAKTAILAPPSGKEGKRDGAVPPAPSSERKNVAAGVSVAPPEISPLPANTTKLTRKQKKALKKDRIVQPQLSPPNGEQKSVAASAAPLPSKASLPTPAPAPLSQKEDKRKQDDNDVAPPQPSVALSLGGEQKDAAVDAPQPSSANILSAVKDLSDADRYSKLYQGAHIDCSLVKVDQQGGIYSHQTFRTINSSEFGYVEFAKYSQDSGFFVGINLTKMPATTKTKYATFYLTLKPTPATFNPISSYVGRQQKYVVSIKSRELRENEHTVIFFLPLSLDLTLPNIFCGTVHIQTSSASWGIQLEEPELRHNLGVHPLTNSLNLNEIRDRLVKDKRHVRSEANISDTTHIQELLQTITKLSRVLAVLTTQYLNPIDFIPVSTVINLNWEHRGAMNWLSLSE